MNRISRTKLLAVATAIALAAGCGDNKEATVDAMTIVPAERGQYIMNVLGACTFCHTPILENGTRDLTRNFAGVDCFFDADGIKVKQQLKTSNPNIYAIGDVVGGPQFTHLANYHAGIVIRNALFRLRPRASAAHIPRVTYTDPEVASVGLSESEARQNRNGVRAWRVPLSEVDRAITMGATEGFLKVVTARGWQRWVPGLSEAAGDEIVGATLVAPNAGDLLMPIVVAMRARLPMGIVAWNMQAYPTLALGLRQAVGQPFDR